MTITDIKVTDLGLRKVAGRIGAELDGVRLSGDLPDAVVAGIREALDVTFVDQPPAASILRAVVIPSYGGDTVWANTVSAYEELPDHLRTLAQGLWAVHSNTFDYAQLALATEHPAADQLAKYAAVFASTEYDTLHPVVRVHPETTLSRSLLKFSGGHSVFRLLPDRTLRVY